MDLHEFDDVFSQLKSFYGETAYAPRMVTMLCAMFQPLTKQEGLSVVEILVQETAKTPSLALIKQKALPLLQRAWARDKDAKIKALAEGEPCHYCDHTGVIFALKRSDPTLEYSFGCIYCQAYKVRGLKYPQVWNDSLKKDFAPISLRLDSISAAEKQRREAFAYEASFKKSIDEKLKTDRARVAAMLSQTLGGEQAKNMLRRVKGGTHGLEKGREAERGSREPEGETYPGGSLGD